LSIIKKLWQSICCESEPVWHGVLLVLGVALGSRLLHDLTPDPTLKNSISEILIAVLLGLLLRNWFGLSPRLKPGVRFSSRVILQVGVVLLGLRLSLQDVAKTGLTALILVGLCITIAMLLALAAGRLFKLPPRLAVLIGVGTAICGNTAIVTTAPVLGADEDETSFAVAVITLFGLVAVLTYPFLGRLLGLSDRAFGLWAGTAVNDTSQVAAVGAMFNQAALDVAIIVKLTRNTLMAPLIMLFGLICSGVLNMKMSEIAARVREMNLSKLVPGFVVGFLVMTLLRTLGVAVGVLPQDVSNPGELQAAASLLKSLDGVSKFAILMALAGVGLNTDLSSLRRIGLKPLIVGAGLSVALAVISLILILFSPLGA
jgi:uncharacterized integral membrane protein (TIGR00698 family)